MLCDRTRKRKKGLEVRKEIDHLRAARSILYTASLNKAPALYTRVLSLLYITSGKERTPSGGKKQERRKKGRQRIPSRRMSWLRPKPTPWDPRSAVYGSDHTIYALSVSSKLTSVINDAVMPLPYLLPSILGVLMHNGRKGDDSQAVLPVSFARRKTFLRHSQAAVRLRCCGFERASFLRVGVGSCSGRGCVVISE
jgi:hypothetical protein